MTKQTILNQVQVCERAENLGVSYDDRMSMMMDLEFSEINVNKLLGFDDNNFAHDINGLRKYFNRETKQFDDCFCPRCNS